MYVCVYMYVYVCVCVCVQKEGGRKMCVCTRANVWGLEWGGKKDSYMPERKKCTGWRRLIGSPKLQIIFHKRAIKYRSLLRKMTCKDKGSYESSPPCIHFFERKKCIHVYTHVRVYLYPYLLLMFVYVCVCRES